jgi:dihydroorotate dehydrogenase (fumarate)
MFSVSYCDVKELAEEIAKPMHATADGRIIIPLCETAEDAETALVTAKRITGRSETLIGLTEPLASLDGLVQELERWLEEHEYESVKQAQGSMSQRNVAEPAAFERANYMKVLQSWKYDPTGVLMR